MENLEKKKRSANITNEQRTLLIEYVKKHPQLTKGKFSSSFTLKDSIQLWNNLAEILNAVNGTRKDWKGWRKCWHDFQSRSKKKHSTIKQSMAKTGGGTMNAETLTTQEEEVLDIMCPTSIDGHPEIEESTVHLLQIPQNEEIMEVEYLDEDIISIIHDVDANNDDYNTVTSQTKEINIDKESNTLQKIVSEKENMNKTSKSYKIKRDYNQQCTVQYDKPIQQSKILQKNINSTQNIESNKEKQTPFKAKDKNTTNRQLKNCIEVSTNLNNIYEKTFELKKTYYENKLAYLKRYAEAAEKATNILEQHFSH